MRSLKDKPTAGSLCLKASGDSHIYDPLEIAYGMTDKVMQGITECIEAHEKILGEEEFFVILQRASDPVLKNVIRQKFYADIFLPEPRPEQMVCLYKKKDSSVIRLWSLPNAKVMAVISEMNWVDERWEKTKFWCDAFYSGRFFDLIREQYHFTHQTKKEFLNSNREKFVHSCGDDLNTSISESRDGSEIGMNEVISSLDTRFK